MFSSLEVRWILTCEVCPLTAALVSAILLVCEDCFLWYISRRSRSPSPLISRMSLAEIFLESSSGSLRLAAGRGRSVLKTFETSSSIYDVNMYSFPTDSRVYGVLDIELLASTYSERDLIAYEALRSAHVSVARSSVHWTEGHH
jgi:hypothetical protein